MKKEPMPFYMVRKRADDYPQLFLGLGEFAEILDMTKGAFSNAYRRASHKFPEPMAKLAMGPVWSIQQIRDWLKK